MIVSVPFTVLVTAFIINASSFTQSLDGSALLSADLYAYYTIFEIKQDVSFMKDTA